jgi:hypothetical protein
MKIDFQFTTQYGTFSDALFFEDDAIPSDSDIEAMKQQRLANWVAVIEAPQPNYVLDADGNIVFDENGNALIQG